ncbi:hypothetical protein KAR91_73280 [Candidatus Pacearchaeota archaeon]|nr:hypothetical protein [Candidatus Pacearchaeota archaeon]
MSNASYRKLKAKIEKLEKDINTLVFHPDSTKAYQIKAQKGFVKAQVDTVMFSSRENSGNGLIDLIN